MAEKNAALNGGCEIEWIEANAFDLLRDYADAGRQYETIVLDPPAFAKNRRTLDTAMRGYKELNLRAMKMLVRAVCSPPAPVHSTSRKPSSWRCFYKRPSTCIAKCASWRNGDRPRIIPCCSGSRKPRI